MLDDSGVFLIIVSYLVKFYCCVIINLDWYFN